MTLIDGDRIITAQLYDDEHEEFTEKKMSIIDLVNAYTDEGVTTADNVFDKIRAEIESYKLSEDELSDMDEDSVKWGMKIAYDIVDKYKAESEPQESEGYRWQMI